MSSHTALPKPGEGLQHAAFLLVFLLVDSLHFVWARLLYDYLNPATGAFFVLLVGTVEIGLYGLITRKLRWQIFRRYFWFFVLLGALVTTSTYLTYRAMGYIDAGTASFLSQLSAVFGLLFGLLWLKEKFSPIQYAGAALALAGLFVFTFKAGDYLRFGSLLMLIGSICYALHAAVTKKYLTEIEFINFFFFRLLCTTAGLFVVSAGSLTLTWPSWQLWLLLLLIGTIDTTVSRTLYYVVLRRINITLMTIILTLSPVMTVLWALVIFGTLPGRQQFIGGFIVLVGVAIVALGNQLYQSKTLKK